MATYDGRFAELLAARIEAEIAKTRADMSSGTAIIREDAAATGMNAAKFIGRVGGLRQALALMKEVEDELAGRHRPVGKDRQREGNGND